GVMIARTATEVAAYFDRDVPKTIVQKYVPGMEFGVFYYRYPGDGEGRIFSITKKHLPSVVGDGASTIRELVVRDDRAICLASLYLSGLRRSPDDVPKYGELVPLTDVGAHSRGAIFLNGGTLETTELRSAFDAVADNFPGFNFGRFDVRSDSIEALQR